MQEMFKFGMYFGWSRGDPSLKEKLIYLISTAFFLSLITIKFGLGFLELKNLGVGPNSVFFLLFCEPEKIRDCKIKPEIVSFTNECGPKNEGLCVISSVLLFYLRCVVNIVPQGLSERVFKGFN